MEEILQEAKNMEEIFQEAKNKGYEVLSEWKNFQIVVGGVGLYDEGENFVKRPFNTGMLISPAEIFYDTDFWQSLFQDKSCFHEGERMRHRARCSMGQHQWEYVATRFFEIRFREGISKAVEYLYNCCI